MQPDNMDRQGVRGTGWQAEYPPMPGHPQFAPYDTTNTSPMYNAPNSPYDSNQPPQWPPFGTTDRSLSLRGDGSMGPFVGSFPTAQGESFTRRHSDFAQHFQSVGGMATNSATMTQMSPSHIGMAPTMQTQQRHFLPPSDEAEEHTGVDYSRNGSGSGGYPYGGG
jgi:hypothetical protein